MAKNKINYTPPQQYTYDQMMHRRHEIKEQSPWLEDYELDALLADEGYNTSEKAPEGYVFSTGEEESGIDYVGNAPESTAPLQTKEAKSDYNPYAAYADQMELGQDIDNDDDDDLPAADIEEKPAVSSGTSQTLDREEYLANQQARQLRDKARKLLKSNIRQETSKMGNALIIYIALQLVITGVITAYLLLIARYKIGEINVFLSTPTNMLPIQGIILMLGMGLPFIGYMYLFRLPLGETVPVRKMRFGNFASLVAFGLGFSITVTYIGNIISNEDFITGGLSNNQNVLADNQGIGLLYSIICICIIPAVVEEFVFRGVILQVLRRKGGDTFAIVLSALMCALVYSNTQGISAFFISLLMGYLVVFSGSVLPAIVVGLIRSGLSLTMTLLGMSLSHDKVTAIDAGATIIFIGIALLSAISILHRYPDFFRIKEDKSSMTLGEKVRVALGTPSMIFLLLYFIFFAIIENIPTEIIIGYLK